jgi:hypothetical protein
MTPDIPDQLQWRVAPALTVALDAGNSVVLLAGGERATLPRPLMAMEAVRQAIAAQRGQLSQDEFKPFAELAALRSFAQQVAELRKDDEDDGEGEPFVMENDDTWETLSGLIDEARDMLGIVSPYPLPDPDPDPCADTDLAEPAAFRWADHRNQHGQGCRWSLVAVSEKQAAGDDKRCPFGCPDSTIEPMPEPMPEPVPEPGPIQAAALRLGPMDHGSQIVAPDGVPLRDTQ